MRAAVADVLQWVWAAIVGICALVSAVRGDARGVLLFGLSLGACRVLDAALEGRWDLSLASVTTL
eukprot:CAMPEP_0119150826 /NCGR_PEP_ID=MMETSP1310-20130426/45437_1 /TAXON_ID=464262 /ORGANISM="Genus nov. species nov., Strain RCC2339" /LENGTH=64 /DNA_ID=CAMNT_0007143051 /DNA_START=133 /DNA_END=324 /DNA_ORIENTATION=-